MAAMQSPDDSSLWWKLTAGLMTLFFAVLTWIWNHVTGNLTTRISKLETTMETRASSIDLKEATEHHRESVELLFKKIDDLKDNMHAQHVELVRAIERKGRDAA